MNLLWIGGAPDAGKTTLARALASRFGCPLYEYDAADLAHHQALAETDETIRAFLDASLEERWIAPSPHDLFERSMRAFRLRWPLVLRDVRALAGPGARPVIVEGFGILPAFVRALGDDAARALFLVPTDAFRQASWRRRGKPSWRLRVSDPTLGERNLLERDRLIADEVRRQAAELGFAVFDIDGAEDAGQILEVAARRFEPFLGAA